MWQADNPSSKYCIYFWYLMGFSNPSSYHMAVENNTNLIPNMYMCNVHV